MCKLINDSADTVGKFAEADKSVPEGLDSSVRRVVKYIITSRVTLSTAESCTGGLIAAAVTSVAGASEIFRGGVAAYSEEIKREVLGVSAETLERFTVYSAEVASEMSSGVMKLMHTDAAIGVTGIAGPGGGSPEKPVGTVYVSVRYKDKEVVKDLALYKEYEDLDRDRIRLLTVQFALEMLEDLLVCESEVN